ncbi:hypothetical protein [Arthrobacter sp. N199823]|uniref:hypothetical protein n=1 Tax=Arthrobacter sp. N199823 TaxID=2058895 RepID=UPI000CE51500|nr:hypothetical protein [Arthrobacter sp. N199823]
MSSSNVSRKHSVPLPVRRTALAAAVVAAAIGTTAAPAIAQRPPMVLVSEGNPDIAFSYSLDGIAFSKAVPDLFSGSPKLVPGQEIEERLWVRNENSVAVEVSVAAEAPLGEREPTRAGLTPSPVVTLAPGAAAPLQVRMWLPESADNSSQSQTWPVRLQVNARESVSSTTQELSYTGATIGIWPLSVAALLGGAGAYLGARKRRMQR